MRVTSCLAPVNIQRPRVCVSAGAERLKSESALTILDSSVIFELNLFQIEKIKQKPVAETHSIFPKIQFYVNKLVGSTSCICAPAGRVSRAACEPAVSP